LGRDDGVLRGQWAIAVVVHGSWFSLLMVWTGLQAEDRTAEAVDREGFEE
jgi:hypothetical protein